MPPRMKIIGYFRYIEFTFHTAFFPLVGFLKFALSILQVVFDMANYVKLEKCLLLTYG